MARHQLQLLQASVCKLELLLLRQDNLLHFDEKDMVVDELPLEVFLIADDAQWHRLHEVVALESKVAAFVIHRAHAAPEVEVGGLVPRSDPEAGAGKEKVLPFLRRPNAARRYAT